MSRYIKADELRHLVLYFADATNLNGNHEQAKAYNHCLRLIDEAKEVMRGEWIQSPNEKTLFHCSRCNNTIYSETEKDREYFHAWCGKCGAYMRGKSNG